MIRITEKPLSQVREKLTNEQMLEQTVTDLEIAGYERDARIDALEEALEEAIKGGDE